jgi:hypothetical protein
VAVQRNLGDDERGHLDRRHACQSPTVLSLKGKAKRYEIKKLSQSTSVRRNRINHGSQAIRPPDAKANSYKSCVDHYGAHTTHPGYLFGNRSFDPKRQRPQDDRSFDPKRQRPQDDRSFDCAQDNIPFDQVDRSFDPKRQRPQDDRSFDCAQDDIPYDQDDRSFDCAQDDISYVQDDRSFDPKRQRP